MLRNGNGGEAREPLSRERICEVALETIDETGLECFSMRMLASALGVRASSLYYHFASKDELMTGVSEFLYRKLGRPPTGGDWAHQVKGTFVQLRDFIQIHPNAAPLLVRDLAYSPVAKKRANVLLKIACRAGLEPTTSASLVSNLVALLVGHSLLALWVAEEAASEQRVDDGNGASADASQVWVHKLFRAETPDAVDLETVASGDGWSNQARSDGPAWSPPVKQRAGPRALSRSKGTMEPPGDAVFLGGLDALIRGFAPD